MAGYGDQLRRDRYGFECIVRGDAGANRSRCADEYFRDCEQRQCDGELHGADEYGRCDDYGIHGDLLAWRRHGYGYVFADHGDGPDQRDSLHVLSYGD